LLILLGATFARVPNTQIVSNPGAPPLFSGPGGNKFKFVLPARAPNTLTGNGVFNLSSQRLFSVKGAGIQHYAINAVADRMDSSGPRSGHVES